MPAEPPASAPSNEPPSLRVTVLCGGPSSEREISLDSGRAVAEALRARGHTVFVADIGPHDLRALDHPADVVFPALHGPFGEDGTVQRLMEERGLRFVGSGSRASAVGMDKAATKEVALAAGFDTPSFEVWDAARLADPAPSGLVPPVIVKPVDQGSSVGTSIVQEPEAFRPAVAESVGQFGRALVEKFITGSEVTVGIVGDLTLPPIRVRPKRTFYDFEAKYHDQATEYLFDTGLPDAVLQSAQAQSRDLFDRLGCRHLARIDWMIDAGERLWFLEVNTLPGFTSHSLVPKGAARLGVAFDELCDRLVRMAYWDRP